MFRLLKIIILWPLTILFIGVVIMICLSFLLQTKIETAAVKQLVSITNNQLSFEEAELNYFSTFPSITLDLLKPKLYDTDYNEAISLEEFQAKLNMWQAIFSKPTISHLLIRNGSVTLTERNQKWNVEELITTKQGTTGKASMIDIENITIENFRILIDRGTAQERYELLLTAATMQLQQDGEQINMAVKGGVSFENVTRQQQFQQIDYEDDFRLRLNYGIDTKLLQIEECVFENGVSIDGSFNAANSKRDMLIKLEQFPLESLNPMFSHLAESSQGLITWSGTADSEIHLDGISDISYQLQLDDADLHYHHPAQELRVTDIHTVVSGDQDICHLKAFAAMIEGELVQAKARINLNRSIIDELEASGTLAAASVFPFLEQEQLSEIRGSGIINNLSLSAYPWTEDDHSLMDYLTISVEAEDLAWKGHDHEWMTAESGVIESAAGIIYLQDLQLSYGASELTVSGEYQRTLDGHQWKGKVTGELVHIDSLMNYASRSDSSGSTSVDAHQYDLSIAIETARYADVILEDLTAQVETEAGVHRLTSSSMAFGGRLQTEGALTMEKNGLHHYQVKTDVMDVDLSMCLQQCQNFGQEYITSDNISGNLNSLGLFHFYWDEDWNIRSDKSRGLVSVNLQEGRIEELTMLEQFSSFVNVKDLRSVRFIELDNYLEIRGKQLYIPTMFIQSNAANLTLSGNHSMDNEQLYYMQVNAGQILMDKFKSHDRSLRPKPAKQKGWFNLYYVVEGDGERYEYKKNKSRVEAAFSNGLLRKEQIYRQLIDEFGYSAKLKLPSDWNKIPEYNLEDD